jgi:hypothetical protein
MKLGLGTAQFGLRYGVANSRGQVSQEDINQILEFCKQIGIDTLDTAIDYGESEECLGRSGISDFSLVTKLPSIPDNCEDINAWILDQVKASLDRLKIDNIYGLLLHKPEQLFSKEGSEILKTLITLKETRIIKKIGISVYSPEEFTRLFSLYDFEIVQCPLNLIDRRLATSGWLEKLESQGVEVHIRSCFLQGLLLMPKIKIPSQFQVWSFLWDEWHDWLDNNRVSALEACIAFVLSHKSIDKAIVGVDSKNQLQEIASFDKSIIKKFPDISNHDTKLINPSYWENL